MVLTGALPVLLIRGLSREQRHWGEFRPLLAARLSNPVLSADFSGCGQLYQQRSACSIQALCQSVRGQVQQAPEFSGRLHLVAISLGGMLAADWATRYPQEVASITLINSSARSLSPFYQRLHWRNYPLILSGIFMSPAQREQLILRLTSATPAQHQASLDNWQLWQQQRPVAKLNTLRQLCAASRFNVGAVPQCPTLLISSLGDKLVSPQCSAALAHYWQVAHIQHPWAGHDLALDAPDWLCTQLSDFISNIKS